MAHAISVAVASIFLRLRKITLSFLERHNNSIVIAAEKKIVMLKNAHEYVKTFGAPKAFCVCRCLLFVNRNINKPICFNGCVSATNKTLIQFRLSRRARCCYLCQMKNNILTQSWNCWDNRWKEKERFYLFFGDNVWFILSYSIHQTVNRINGENSKANKSKIKKNY